jgi:hypothetical protein
MSARANAVEDYLDELLGGLRGRPAEVRRFLAETEEHLYSAIADGVAAGLSIDDAACQGISRFGTAAQVASTWSANASLVPTNIVLRRLGAQLVPLAGAGLLAVGVSGLLARAMTSVWGLTFMFADPKGTQYRASECHYWMSIHPRASSCTNAYLAEAMADGLMARYTAGALGIVVLVVVALVRRRQGNPIIAMPSALTSLIGAAVFIAAGFALAGFGTDSLRVRGGHGAGQWLSGAAVALPIGIFYAREFIRATRRTPAPTLV